MIKAGIIGSTGYAGAELVRLLTQHPETEVIWCGSRSCAGDRYSSVYQNMYEIVDRTCEGDDLEALAEMADVVFTATPQGYCASMLSEKILAETKIIDLSADFRLKDVKVYEAWYKLEHRSPQFLPEAVYGLCEINREAIRQTRLLANPGCYTTCSILSLYPLVKEGVVDPGSLIIDAKSGTSGAGRGAKVGNLFCEVNESMKAYSVGTHRHTPEIEEQLSLACGQEVILNFTPHLVPMQRGILVTAYGSLTGAYTWEELSGIYEKYYGREYFIRLLKKGICAETRWVEGSNFVDIGWTVDPRTGRVIVMGALDNLVKGAAGQAVQNMNLMFGLPENTGLTQVPLFP